MAGTGRAFDFHGSFGSKAAAVAKERATPGAFVKRVKRGTETRYLVMSPHGGGGGDPPKSRQENWWW